MPSDSSRSGWVLATAWLGIGIGLLAAARSAAREENRRIAGVMAVAAGVLAADAATARRLPPASMRASRTPVRAATTIARSPDDVYAFWRDFENLPTFMAHVESVEVTSDRGSRWTVKAPAGLHVRWEAEIVDDVPGRVIAWRSLPGSDIDNSGSVRFAPARDGRATEVRIELWHDAPSGRLSEAVAKLFGEEPDQQVKDDLRRLKQVLETGEIARSDASPAGISAGQQLHQRRARPTAAGG